MKAKKIYTPKPRPAQAETPTFEHFDARAAAPQKAPLKPDELIDFLERSYKDVLGELQQLSCDMLPVLLLAEEALITNQGSTADGGLYLKCEGKKISYCTVGGAVAHLLCGLCDPLYDSSNRADLWSHDVSRAMDVYREAKQKIASETEAKLRDTLKSGIKHIKLASKFYKS